LPDFDRLWTDCTQEEARLESKNDRKHKGNSDENQALVAHTKKGIKGGSLRERGISIEPTRKKDLSKFKCFACHEFGHYPSQCPQWRRGGRKQQASTVEVDEVADMLQREFLLVSTLSGTFFDSGTWLVDSGALCCMT
jgi:hypothetical protein